MVVVVMMKRRRRRRKDLEIDDEASFDNVVAIFSWMLVENEVHGQMDTCSVGQ
jgi:hypothetical protein